jgi:hypothetical protein
MSSRLYSGLARIDAQGSCGLPTPASKLDVSRLASVGFLPSRSRRGWRTYRSAARLARLRRVASVGKLAARSMQSGGWKRFRPLGDFEQNQREHVAASGELPAAEGPYTAPLMVSSLSGFSVRQFIKSSIVKLFR